MTVWINKAHRLSSVFQKLRKSLLAQRSVFCRLFSGVFAFACFFPHVLCGQCSAAPWGLSFWKHVWCSKCPKYPHDISWLRVLEQQVRRLLAEVLVACYLARKRQHGAPKIPWKFYSTISKLVHALAYLPYLRIHDMTGTDLCLRCTLHWM